jgi:hypothetical protein
LDFGFASADFNLRFSRVLVFCDLATAISPGKVGRTSFRKKMAQHCTENTRQSANFISVSPKLLAALVIVLRRIYITVMTNHKYRIGQTVLFRGFSRNNSPSGEYEVLRLLPSGGGELQYRIKSKHETHERVVGEEQLSTRATVDFLTG